MDELLFGRDWWREKPELLNQVLEYHPGLRFAASLAREDFRWPSTEALESMGIGEIDLGFQQTTPLFDLGYRITGFRREDRWDILTQTALPELGLREVVETIANHVRTRKAQQGGRHRYAYAIQEWEHDLDRLKRSYFRSEVAGFRWPRTEP